MILNRANDQGFGFSVRGDSPVKVADIEPGSVAEVTKKACQTCITAPDKAEYLRIYEIAWTQKRN